MTTQQHRSLGTIGRYELLIATRPAPRSKYQIEQGHAEEIGVWLMHGGRCVWGSTVARVAANPHKCGEAIVGVERCAELAAMVAAA